MSISPTRGPPTAAEAVAVFKFRDLWLGHALGRACVICLARPPQDEEVVAVSQGKARAGAVDRRVARTAGAVPPTSRCRRPVPSTSRGTVNTQRQEVAALEERAIRRAVRLGPRSPPGRCGSRAEGVVLRP